MTKNKVYRYFGRNGMITTSIVLEGATSVTMYRLTADADKYLTNGQVVVNSIDLFEDELNDWYEISKPSNKGQN